MKELIPIGVITKKEIENEMDNFLNNALEKYTPLQLYISIKQMEYAVKYGLELIKNLAIDSLQNVDGNKLSVAGSHISLQIKESVKAYTGDIGKQIMELEEKIKELKKIAKEQGNVVLDKQTIIITKLKEYHNGKK